MSPRVTNGKEECPDRTTGQPHSWIYDGRTEAGRERGMACSYCDTPYRSDWVELVFDASEEDIEASILQRCKDLAEYEEITLEEAAERIRKLVTP